MRLSTLFLIHCAQAKRFPTALHLHQRGRRLARSLWDQKLTFIVPIHHPGPVPGVLSASNGDGSTDQLQPRTTKTFSSQGTSGGHVTHPLALAPLTLLKRPPSSQSRKGGSPITSSRSLLWHRAILSVLTPAPF